MSAALIGLAFESAGLRSFEFSESFRGSLDSTGALVSVGFGGSLSELQPVMLRTRMTVSQCSRLGITRLKLAENRGTIGGVFCWTNKWVAAKFILHSVDAIAKQEWWRSRRKPCYCPIGQTEHNKHYRTLGIGGKRLFCGFLDSNGVPDLLATILNVPCDLSCSTCLPTSKRSHG